MIRAAVMFDKLQAMTEEYSRNPTPKLLKEIQDTKKHIPQHQEQLSKPTGTGQVQTHTTTLTHAHTQTPFLWEFRGILSSKT